MIDLILGIVSGGATGILGSLVGRVFGFFETRSKNAHELDLIEAAAKSRKFETESEMAIAITKEEGALKRQSYRHDASYGETHMWVADFLRMVRPILTFALIAAAIWMAFYLKDDDLGITEVRTQLTYLSSMAVAWWFGDRGRKKK